MRTLVLALLVAAPLAGQADMSQEERRAILQGRSCAGRDHQLAWACSLWLGEPHEVIASKAALTAAAWVADAVEAAELEEVERFEVSLRIAAQSLEAALYFAGSACADKLPAAESWATIGDFASGSIIPAYAAGVAQSVVLLMESKGVFVDRSQDPANRNTLRATVDALREDVAKYREISEEVLTRCGP